MKIINFIILALTPYFNLSYIHSRIKIIIVVILFYKSTLIDFTLTILSLNLITSMYSNFCCCFHILIYESVNVDKILSEFGIIKTKMNNVGK